MILLGAWLIEKTVLERANKLRDAVTKAEQDKDATERSFRIESRLIEVYQVAAHAKQNGLLVPLKGYKIHVVGASTRGSSPQAWNTVKKFWELYFRAARADLVSYSAECDVER